MLLELFNISDKELAGYIRDISSGNEAVLERFYKNYAQSMYSMIYSYVKSKESAEEVLQDVLIRIVTYGFDKPIKKPKAWLFTVIKNASVKKAAEEKRKQTESLWDNENLMSDDNVFKMIEDSIDQIESLKCLTHTEQNCVLLCVIGGLKLPEVAEIMDIPYERVRSIYYYALKKLRQYYKGEKSHEQQTSDRTSEE